MRSPGTPSNILLIGASLPVLETIVGELASLGHSVQGTTHAASASMDFNAVNFDLIAIGGGIAADLRRRLKEDFGQQNPDVQMVDVFAPSAVREIAETLAGRRNQHLLDLDAYFKRIDYSGPGRVCLATLSAIQQRHIDAIAFEAMDVISGRGVDVSPQAVETKLVQRGRGGYCAEQNSLLMRVLRQLGFHVECLSARVVWQAKPGGPAPPRTHMLLKVVLEDLPFLVDAGFGGAVLPSPIRMDIATPQPTTHEDYRVFPFGNTYRLQIQRDGAWLTLYDLYDTPICPADIEMMNWYTSRHPDSPFRKRLIAARTTPEARFALLNSRLTVRNRNGKQERTILDPYDMAEVLRDLFGLAIEPSWRPVLERVLDRELAMA